MLTGVVPLARVVRSGFVESVHHGLLVVIGPDGRPELVAGEPTATVFPRSSSKPLQLLAMLRAGLDAETVLPGPLLALAQASHSGESFHLAGVRRILQTVGLDDSALQNTPDLPLDPQERASWLATAHPPTSLAQNCSGKHAAMLATCVAAGWPTATYLEPDHPLQQLVIETISELAVEPVSAVGVDGCGAPVAALSLVGLARAFSTLARAQPGTLENVVAQGIRDFPEWLGGTGRDVTRLIQGVPGLVAKDGAEGVYALALPDGRALALKVADGGERGRPPILAAALQAVGVEAPVLDELLTEAVVLGHGRRVGRVEPVDLSAYLVGSGA